jgi:hypothetical protein
MCGLASSFWALTENHPPPVNHHRILWALCLLILNASVGFHNWYSPSLPMNNKHLIPVSTPSNIQNNVLVRETEPTGCDRKRFAMRSWLLQLWRLASHKIYRMSWLSWRPRKAGGVVPIWVWRPKNQEIQSCNSSANIVRLRTQKESLCFKDRKKLMPRFKSGQIEKREFFLSVLEGSLDIVFYSVLKWVKRAKPPYDPFISNY